MRSARNASRSLRVCVGAGRERESARVGRVAVREQIFDGECVVRAAGVHWRCEGRTSAREGGEKMLGKGVSLCGDGSRSSAGNGW